MLQLFPTTAPLMSMCIDILGGLICTQRQNEYLFVITDIYTKLTNKYPMKVFSATEVANNFLNAWAFNYCPPEKRVVENAGCFMSKFFQNVCRIMKIENTYSTKYHTETNWNVERSNRTIFPTLHAYVAGYHRDWDLYVDALKFAYNCQPRKFTCVAPFQRLLSKPPEPITIKQMPATTEPQGDFKRNWKH